MEHRKNTLRWRNILHQTIQLHHPFHTSVYTKFNFDVLTKLVTSNWIENNYKGKMTYPMVLKCLIATYIQFIVEQWKAPSDCTISRGLIITQQTVRSFKRNESTSAPNIGTHINGSILVSTDRGCHRWKLRIQSIHQQMLIGLDKMCRSGRVFKYGMILYENQYICPDQLPVSELLDNHWTRDLWTHVMNGDMIIMTLTGTLLKTSIIRRGGYVKTTEITIEDGVYQLAGKLFDYEDSISLLGMNSRYDLPYRDFNCTNCGSKIRLNWRNCPRCNNSN